METLENQIGRAEAPETEDKFLHKFDKLKASYVPRGLYVTRDLEEREYRVSPTKHSLGSCFVSKSYEKCVDAAEAMLTLDVKGSLTLRQIVEDDNCNTLMSIRSAVKLCEKQHAKYTASPNVLEAMRSALAHIQQITDSLHKNYKR